MIPNIEERRSYVRGDFSYKVKFRVLSSNECKVRKMTGTQISFLEEKKLKMDNVLADSKDAAMPLNPGLMAFLIQMDEKLDQILSMLSDNEEANQLFKQGLGVDISATGMGIITEIEVKPSQTIHANIILSRLPFVSIDVIGEIVQVLPNSEEDKPMFHVGIRFIDLQADDKEKIIKCVFQKERASIRERKRIEKGSVE
jgi:PilZ domain-containing protein